MKRIHLIEMLAVMLGLMSSCTDNNDNPSGGENRWGDKTLTFNVDNVSFNMIQVEGGSYQMNTLNDDSGAKLNISGTLSDYYIGQTEVTNQLWASVMGYRPELQFHDADEYQRPAERSVAGRQKVPPAIRSPVDVCVARRQSQI